MARYRRTKRADACVKTCWRDVGVGRARGRKRFKLWKKCLDTCYSKPARKKPKKRRRR